MSIFSRNRSMNKVNDFTVKNEKLGSEVFMFPANEGGE